MSDEIIAGLRNALARGQSLNDAVQSFVNAGYNPAEVREAGKMLSEGASQIIGPSELNANRIVKEKSASVNSFPKLSQSNAVKPVQTEDEKGKKILLIGLLIILMLIILGGIGYLVYYFFL